MNQEKTAKLTVSQEKVWMKHYPAESQNFQLPRMKVYSFLKEANKNRLHDTIIYYYGTRITVKQLIDKIDQVADAFAALGVKAGDTVSLTVYRRGRTFVMSVCLSDQRLADSDCNF